MRFHGRLACGIQRGPTPPQTRSTAACDRQREYSTDTSENVFPRVLPTPVQARRDGGLTHCRLRSVERGRAGNRRPRFTRPHGLSGRTLASEDGETLTGVVPRAGRTEEGSLGFSYGSFNCLLGWAHSGVVVGGSRVVVGVGVALAYARLAESLPRADISQQWDTE